MGKANCPLIGKTRRFGIRSSVDKVPRSFHPENKRITERGKTMYEKIMDLIDRMNKDCIKNADKHFTVPYDELHPECQHEHEGIMWGWQDFAKKLKGRLVRIETEELKKKLKKTENDEKRFMEELDRESWLHRTFHEWDARKVIELEDVTRIFRKIFT